MQKLLDETEAKAYVFLKEFGFEEDEIVPIVAKGKRNLETTLKNFEQMLSLPEAYSHDEADSILHALKGLLAQMGNKEKAEETEALREHLDRQKMLAWLERSRL
ncbi:hypothetical protein [Sulfurovum sp.]|uniref:hypothetical protein n=1 Tax=Sulfurovum sp. TaxID=1969726 RepID=UPI0025D20524|nr:hypothetical protein [Sulfurovum sp.]